MITVTAHHTAASGAADVVRGRLARHAAASRLRGASAETALPAKRRGRKLVELLTAQSRTMFRPSSVTPPTTCSPLAVEIDHGELT